MRRSLIVEEFLGRLPPKLRAEIALIPGIDGFERLFEQLGFAVPLIKAHREEGETRYEIDQGSRDDFPELHFTVPVRLGAATSRVPSGDVGLTILPGQTMLFGGEQYSITSIDRTPIEAHVSAGAADVALPILEYRWIASPGPRPERPPELPPQDPVSTWLIENRQPGGNISLVHHYGSMTRRTVGRISLKQEVQPLNPQDNPGAVIASTGFEAGVQHEQRRDYQSILQLHFLYLPDVKQSELAAFAFTTCVVLQDVVRARFPRWPHRLQAVSPQASEIFERYRNGLAELSWPQGNNPQGTARLDRLLAAIYPRLIVDKPVSSAVGRQATDDPKVGSFDVFLIEDSDFDLGVVRQIQSDPAALIGQIRRYLEWLRGRGFASRYHQFGGGVNSQLLKFDRVLSLVENLR